MLGSHKLSKQDVKNFVLAGNALITLESGKTGKRYTYKVSKLNKPGTDVWFVKLLVGDNNDTDYEYICYFNKNMRVAVSAKSRMPMDSKPVQAFDFFLKHIDAVPDNLHVYHSCKCGRCGRTLTTPESITRGIGPECYKRGA